MASGIFRYSPSQILRILLISAGIFFKFVSGRLIRAGNRMGRPAHQSPDSKNAIFFYSQVVWQEVWQRPQEMSLRLSRHLPVIFISPVQVHRRFDSVPDWRQHLQFNDPGTVDVYQPLILPGEYKFRFIRWVNRQIVTDWVRDILARHGHPTIFISNSPFSPHLLRAFDWPLKIYDIIDDFIHCQWAPPESAQLEREQIERCDMIFTGTRRLYETKQELHDRIHFIPLGVNFDQFQFDETPAPPEDLREIPAPRIGYIGSISERIDPQIIAGLAERYPDAHLVMIGPVHGSFGAPPTAPNIHYLGPRPHDEIGRYLAHMDLALIPFRQNRMTQSLNPIKTLEYLAAGRVVISTSLPDIQRFYSDVVVIADSNEEFIEKVGEWLRRDRRELEARAMDRARRHSWDTMAERMWEKIRERLDRMKSRRKPVASR